MEYAGVAQQRHGPDCYSRHGDQACTRGRNNCCSGTTQPAFHAFCRDMLPLELLL